MLDLFNTGLTDLLHRLDSRYEEKVKKDGTIMAKKHRKFGGYLSTKPPEDAPEWTVNGNGNKVHVLQGLYPCRREPLHGTGHLVNI